MQRLHYVKCSPGGNITTLVFTEVDRAQQSSVARQIMALQQGVEQVGFVEKPSDPRAVARLQMMGGEFCGNATRSLAWVLWEREWPRTTKGEGTIALEVSGAERLLQVQICGRVAKVEMPIKRERESVRRIGDKIIVELEGISHVIVDQPPPLNAKDEANRLLDELDLKSLKAAGVLYCQPCKDGISMTPIVWVRKTGTLKEETACASGTACVALAQAATTQRDVENLKVNQPSGAIITASVRLGDGCFLQAFIEGSVEILEEGDISVDVHAIV